MAEVRLLSRTGFYASSPFLQTAQHPAASASMAAAAGVECGVQLCTISSDSKGAARPATHTVHVQVEAGTASSSGGGAAEQTQQQPQQELQEKEVAIDMGRAGSCDSLDGLW
jgi:hypothetical protein